MIQSSFKGRKTKFFLQSGESTPIDTGLFRCDGILRHVAPQDDSYFKGGVYVWLRG